METADGKDTNLKDKLQLNLRITPQHLTRREYW